MSRSDRSLFSAICAKVAEASRGTQSARLKSLMAPREDFVNYTPSIAYSVQEHQADKFDDEE